jgi:hypothetical protein
MCILEREKEHIGSILKLLPKVLNVELLEILEVFDA